MENNLECRYHTADENINTIFQKLYYDTLQNHNNSIIINIKNVINIKYFYINGKKININSKVQNNLLMIIKELEDKIELAKRIEHSDLETYRKLVYNYMGRNIFHKIKDNIYMCYTNIRILFPGLDHTKDIIAKTGLSLSEIFLNITTKTGGNKNNNSDYTIGGDYVFDYDATTDNEYDKIMDKLILENTGEAVKFGIYYAVSKYDWDNNYETMYNLYNILYNFYSYNGATILNSNFLEKIVQLYRNNELSKMSCKEFDKMANDYIKSIPTEEEKMAKIMDEWESDIRLLQSRSNSQTRKRGRSFLNIMSPPRNYTRKISKSR